MRIRTLSILALLMSVTLAAQQDPYQYPQAKKITLPDSFGRK